MREAVALDNGDCLERVRLAIAEVEQPRQPVGDNPASPQLLRHDTGQIEGDCILPRHRPRRGMTVDGVRILLCDI
jgi:hypothetical protein